MMIFSLAACGQGLHQAAAKSTPSNESATRSEAPESQATKTSEAETSSMTEKRWSSTFPGLELQKKWLYIAEQTGADLLKLSLPIHTRMIIRKLEMLQEKNDTNARPAIANLPDSIEEYDSIFIGYPIWWHTAPMIIGTFLESYDLSGVDIYPFTQSASMDTNNNLTIRWNSCGTVPRMLLSMKGYLQEHQIRKAFPGICLIMDLWNKQENMMKRPYIYLSHLSMLDGKIAGRLWNASGTGRQRGIRPDASSAFTRTAFLPESAPVGFHLKKRSR